MLEVSYLGETIYFLLIDSKNRKSENYTFVLKNANNLAKIRSTATEDT